MLRANRLMLSDFVYNDRFELNSYLASLFHQFHNNVPEQPGDKIDRNNQRFQWIYSFKDPFTEI